MLQHFFKVQHKNHLNRKVVRTKGKKMEGKKKGDTYKR